MGIENDINQTSFRNPHQKAVINLIYTWHWINNKLRKNFDQEGITSQQFNILRILRGAGEPLTTLQIRQRMLDRMSDTSRIVDRLVGKDLVQKTVCPSDRRLVDISITAKGEKLLQQMDKYENEIDLLFSNLSDTEASQLNKLLDKIRNNNND